jgi:hypothetical protein
MAAATSRRAWPVAAASFVMSWPGAENRHGHSGYEFYQRRRSVADSSALIGQITPALALDHHRVKGFAINRRFGLQMPDDGKCAFAQKNRVVASPAACMIAEGSAASKRRSPIITGCIVSTLAGLANIVATVAATMWHPGQLHLLYLRLDADPFKRGHGPAPDSPPIAFPSTARRCAQIQSCHHQPGKALQAKHQRRRAVSLYIRIARRSV